jgi:hypothetical protein
MRGRVGRTFRHLSVLADSISRHTSCSPERCNPATLAITRTRLADAGSAYRRDMPRTSSEDTLVGLHRFITSAPHLFCEIEKEGCHIKKIRITDALKNDQEQLSNPYQTPDLCPCSPIGSLGGVLLHGRKVCYEFQRAEWLWHHIATGRAS